jgi:LmbE family N-acetylglucosaminyl deacetylase
VSETVLVVVAHADDEVLGAGGTIARHHENGDTVCLLVVADGVSARYSCASDPAAIPEMNQREAAAQAAADLLGIQEVTFLRFPDNRCDTVSTLDIVKAIEAVLRKLRPTTVYTHYLNDLNLDHRVVHQALVTACRPLPGQTVKKILGFEVLSSTEWELGTGTSMFRPSYFVDISEYLGRKLDAMAAYKAEINSFPHPRSMEVIRAKSIVRGAEVGLEAAEAFVVIREIV